jgi:hypothetical protein
MKVLVVSQDDKPSLESLFEKVRQIRQTGIKLNQPRINLNEWAGPLPLMVRIPSRQANSESKCLSFFTSCSAVQF